eukprot:3173666-Prymnesium_polylepis.1
MAAAAMPRESWHVVPRGVREVCTYRTLAALPQATWVLINHGAPLAPGLQGAARDAVHTHAKEPRSVLFRFVTVSHL